MAETEPMCARAIIDVVDGEYRSEVDDEPVLRALANSSIRALASRAIDGKRQKVSCQVPGCAAECMLQECSNGLFLAEIQKGETEPIPDEDCAVLRSGW